MGRAIVMSKTTTIKCDGCGMTIITNPAILGSADELYAVQFHGACMDWERTTWDYCSACWNKMVAALVVKEETKP